MSNRFGTYPDGPYTITSEHTDCGRLTRQPIEACTTGNNDWCVNRINFRNTNFSNEGAIPVSDLRVLGSQIIISPGFSDLEVINYEQKDPQALNEMKSAIVNLLEKNGVTISKAEIDSSRNELKISAQKDGKVISLGDFILAAAKDGMVHEEVAQKVFQHHKYTKQREDFQKFQAAKSNQVTISTNDALAALSTNSGVSIEDLAKALQTVMHPDGTPAIEQNNSGGWIGASTKMDRLGRGSSGHSI